MNDTDIAQISGLCVDAPAGNVLDSIDLDIRSGEVLGLVGESGSGKTSLALALLGATTRGAQITHGQVTVAGTAVFDAAPDELQALRGRVVTYVPQDPVLALNPSMRIGRQITEVARAHSVPELGSVAERTTRAVRMAGLPDNSGDSNVPEGRGFLRRWPHQISGGQQQRVTLGQALVNRPRLLLLDEPTTGLDPNARAALLERIRTLANETGCAVVHISHDLAAITAIADRIAVMYAGRIAEIGAAHTVRTQPAHPYTIALLDAIPAPTEGRLPAGLPGNPPALDERSTGCHFADRCILADPYCRDHTPPMTQVLAPHAKSEQVAACGRDLLAAQHTVSCHRHTETAWLGRTHEHNNSGSHSDTDARATSTGDPARGDVGRVDGPQSLFESTADTGASDSPWQAPALEVRGLRASHRAGGRRRIIAAHDVDLTLYQGECLAMIGDSGTGKSTVARCLAGLHRPDNGEMIWGGQRLAANPRRRSRAQRRAIQLVPQNPADTLDPARTVLEQVARPARVLRGMSTVEAVRAARTAVELVRLPAGLAERRPGELSGGERQRAAIARAVIAEPDVLVCDEITSALDACVQAAVVELIAELRRDLGLALLFISHDHDLVDTVADRVGQLDDGRLTMVASAAAVQAPSSTGHALAPAEPG